MTIIVKRPTKPIGEADVRAPTGDRAKAAIVGYEVSDVDALALCRKRPDLVFPAAICRDNRLGQICQTAGFVATDIKCQSLGFWRNRGIEERFGRIIDVEEIPTLLAAPDLEGLPLYHPALPNA